MLFRSRRTRRPRRPRAAVAVVTLCMLTAVTSCSSGSSSKSSSNSSTGPSSSSSAASGSGTTITIQNFAFHPAALTVAPGAKITVTNKDSTPHTVTATGKKVFDTGTIAAGKTVTFTAPSKAGSYPYMCTIHQYMKGSLTVR
ncbi:MULTISPECIES: cupredoxin domain-containing protein [unclassified Streptomyces]|uniref:cupredoxin domain-containing protein n=1 Tax=unclassified Streptomyces TaxID=2593676 RepID=UPI002DDA2127|nr:cupredoxin domain-containing protein [Streptomyces sp. NBC_01766]WSC21271.1 cupredoxin domain-containing protein [Streptomyces sp. NBC_01766]